MNVSVLRFYEYIGYIDKYFDTKYQQTQIDKNL